jgi:biotin carboxyl carrier protein
MPGVVVEILVEVGQRVEPGQPLLILEAMKMQNEIAAGTSGVVTALHVSRGQAIEGGALLATIAAPAVSEAESSGAPRDAGRE